MSFLFFYNGEEADVDKKMMSQILVKRASQFSAKQWEQLMEELEKRNMYLCIEAVSHARTLFASEILIPTANKDDGIKIMSGEELEQRNLPLNHQFLETVNK
jgi:hypothetical protein